MTKGTTMKKIIGAAIVAVMLSACTSGDKAREVLAAQGFTNIQITGYKVFGCSEDDTFHTGFVAKAPNGTTVSGVVCSGFLKGSTVRF